MLFARVVVLVGVGGRSGIRVGVWQVVGLVRSVLVVVSHGANHHTEEGEEDQAITLPSALMIPVPNPALRIWAMSIQTGMAMSAAGDMIGSR